MNVIWKNMEKSIKKKIIINSTKKKPNKKPRKFEAIPQYIHVIDQIVVFKFFDYHLLN